MFVIIGFHSLCASAKCSSYGMTHVLGESGVMGSFLVLIVLLFFSNHDLLFVTWNAIYKFSIGHMRPSNIWMQVYDIWVSCNVCSLLVSSSMAKMIKSRSQTSANPKLIVSSTNPKLIVSSTEPMWNSKISVEGSKLCPIKAGTRKPDLSIRSSKYGT